MLPITIEEMHEIAKEKEFIDLMENSIKNDDLCNKLENAYKQYNFLISKNAELEINRLNDLFTIYYLCEENNGDFKEETMSIINCSYIMGFVAGYNHNERKEEPGADENPIEKTLLEFYEKIKAEYY